MEIINFDSGSSRENKRHFLLPDCHYMIIGPIGCGKTRSFYTYEPAKFLFDFHPPGGSVPN